MAETCADIHCSLITTVIYYDNSTRLTLGGSKVPKIAKTTIHTFTLGCVHTCSSIILVCLVQTKKENDQFGPCPLSVHTGIFDSVHTYSNEPH